METLIMILEFMKEHWGWVTVLLGGIIQISPIKIYPVEWIKKGLRWLGKYLTGSLEEEIKEVKKNVEKLEYEFDQKRIKDLRYEILKFGDNILIPGFTADRETYEHIIYDVHEEYAALLQKYNMKNGKVSRAMKRISDRYEELLIDPNF